MEKLASAASISAIVTVLQPPFAGQVTELWQEFSAACRTQFVLTQNPIPHFTWQTAESYDEPALEEVLQEIAQQSEPFTARTSGIGMFTGSMVIVYISIVKTDPLIRFQQHIWESTRRYSHNINHYYQPELWMPHITLAYDPLDHQTLTCVLDKIAARRFEWELPVNQLALIHAGKGSELRSGKRFPMGRKIGSL